MSRKSATVAPPAVAVTPLALPYKEIRPPRIIAAGVLAGVVASAVVAAVRPKSIHPAAQVAADAITATVVVAHPVETLWIGRVYRKRGFTTATVRKAQLTSLTMGIFGTYTAWRAARRATR